ncbi:MAG: DUF2950 family protein [Phyllobacterium sp.]
MDNKSLKALLASVILSGALSVPAWAADPSLQRFVGAEPTAFHDPAAAVDELRKDLEAGDAEAIAKLLGLKADEVKKSEDFGERLAELEDAARQNLILEDMDDGAKIVLLGDLIWPFPFPLLKHDAGWRFDTLQGLEEVLARRIGENELEAIHTLRNVGIAQAAYAQEDHDGDGVLEFAQKVLSEKGKQDGLYWDAAGNGESPAGDLGDPAGIEDSPASEHGYFGYRYRVLKRQGGNIAGGKYGFVINGNMIAGQAMIAWPAKYGQTGIMTFVVSHHGAIYEKDMGPGTEQAAKEIRSFNPDRRWEPVEE